MNINIAEEPKIRVVVRKRPLTKKELARGEQDIVDIRDGNSVSVRELKQKVDLTKYIDQHNFTFDSAYDKEANNETIYVECVRPLVVSAFQGAKVTCFAYGQTGSGKTYTMNGDMANRVPGMYIYGAHDIFNIKEQPQFAHLNVLMSFYEIYCGKLYDLLNNREVLQARQDSKANVNIVGITEKKINNVQNFMQVIEQGSSVRITSQNSTNADSSRSHAIMQITLMEGKKVFGKISFIDLAGCERGADTIDQNKQTRIDGAEINKSLLALKECIRALDNGKSHTPFRGSKLTMVLKDSFTGFCKTLMIGNISPGLASCENTLNTLRYADRVKELKKGEGVSSVSKEDQLAKELMLPRMQKNKQTITLTSDDQDEDWHTISNNNHARRHQTMMEEDSSSHHNHMPRNNNPKDRQPKKENEDGLFNRNQNNLVGQGLVMQTSNLININSNQANVTQNVNNNSGVKSINITIPDSLNNNKPKSVANNPSGYYPRTQQQLQSNAKSITLELPAEKPNQYPPIQNTEFNNWEQMLEQYRTWEPMSRTQIHPMTTKYEKMVEYIHREENQVLKQHKEQLLANLEFYSQSHSLYSKMAMADAKTGQDMAVYATTLESFLDAQINTLFNLKNKLGSFKYHLKQQQSCEMKLTQANNQLVNNREEDEISLLDEVNNEEESYFSIQQPFTYNYENPSSAYSSASKETSNHGYMMNNTPPQQHMAQHAPQPHHHNQQPQNNRYSYSQQDSSPSPYHNYNTRYSMNLAKNGNVGIGRSNNLQHSMQEAQLSRNSQYNNYAYY